MNLSTLELFGDKCYWGILQPVRYQTLFEIIQFFEDEYGIFIDVNTTCSVNEILCFEYTLKSWRFSPVKSKESYKTKEECLEAAVVQILKECI